MRDSNIIIIGFLFLMVGYLLQISHPTISSSYSSSLCGNAGTILQLIATTSVIVGIVMLVIGVLNMTRRRSSSPMNT